ncbi:glycoside hydrolase family 20 zincin-like fold domain-containing protein [Maribacter sp. R77961]|uniref:glycoside hydrolase family 20 zincin-like fold domain-containing protein n=1 Tax=Maribacter sp. R77961 TaxID=3093871 RepID=UPI0037CA065F
MKTYGTILLLCSIVTLTLLFSGCEQESNELSISAPQDIPQVDFAINELETVLTANETCLKSVNTATADITVSITESEQIAAEGFELIVADNKIRLFATDTAGLMYGILELAEQIQINGFKGVKNTLQNPHMQMRGTKFNIPLDVRTPSYSDASEVAQHNIPVMWEFDFWTAYIDNLAKHRYNYISLWNLHPFPSLVKVPGYEEIALDDVYRSTIDWKENYHLHATDIATPEITENFEVIKKLGIEEKIAFWQKVMRYAKERNIDFYFITWNIFTNGTNGQYGITDDPDNEITKDYFRKSIKQLFVSYPDLKGIGLTTGENMPGIGFEEKETWAFDTYAKAVLEVAKEMPDRNFTFIHRQHQTGAKAIAEKFKPVIDAKNIEFLYCFKYAKAHALSTTEQHYHQNFVKDIAGMETIWGLRNDDAYYFRWGAPDFVREFISNIPYEVSRGIYYGSDQWIWGREFLTKNPETKNQLEIEKHWYHWMLWGRLGYNPEVSNERLQGILQNKFKDVNSKELFSAWQEASMVYPTTTAFHWGDVDFKWYIEGSQSRPGPANNTTGFHDVNRFITLPPHPKSGFQSIPDYVVSLQTDEISKELNPLQVSEKLHSHANKALAFLKTDLATQNKELEYTLNDIKTMAFMGKYYAHKIAGATHLALFRETKNKEHQNRAVEELNLALDFWKKYTAQAMQQNKNPLWTNRVGYVDWEKTTKLVAEDIEIALK